MSHSKYEHYQAEDFMMDDYFQNWMRHQNEEAVRFWTAWVEAHPEKREAVEQAALLLSSMQFPRESLSQDEAGTLLNRVHHTIETAASASVIPLYPSRDRGWFQVAAVIALLLLSVATLWLWNASRGYIVERTAFGATKQVLLPDSSRVVLNGNSSLRYAKEWESGSPREVWLEGEGFFSVMHKRNNQRFIVHASDELDVEVLGTTFSVANRSAGVRVVLNTGEVLLSLHRQVRERSVAMRPGDLVQVDYKSGEMEKKRVNPANYSSWVEHTLTFEKTTLREVASLLEETYGLQVIMEDPALYDIKVSGSTPVDKGLEMFFEGLEETFNLHIRQEKNRVVVERKNREPLSK